jgi:hypothetical protein
VKSAFQPHSGACPPVEGFVASHASYWPRVTSVLSMQYPCGSCTMTGPPAVGHVKGRHFPPAASHRLASMHVSWCKKLMWSPAQTCSFSLLHDCSPSTHNAHAVPTPSAHSSGLPHVATVVLVTRSGPHCTLSAPSHTYAPGCWPTHTATGSRQLPVVESHNCAPSQTWEDSHVRLPDAHASTIFCA